ncbi:MAG: DUF2344 domain-containing protein [Holophagaceae bacterium]|uniref:DUF2344 domain-containing protein n=1 Tax=Candidatus Geothrix skivensis TaxID=2954439 RepID=A0A9D7XHD2_9BACT|nr:DUF2344 domain-containing protein [Candidatus Geothrix skivensis]
MSSPTLHPSIPAEALIRRARLQATLQGLEIRGGSLEPPPLQALRGYLASREEPDLDRLMATITEGHFEEEAGELLRASRRDSGHSALMRDFASRLLPLAEKAKQRREMHWQLDTRRQSVRFQFSKVGPACSFDEGDLHAIFLLSFRLEGLLVELDLAKRPRPQLGAGLPLPAGVGGLAESLDVVFRREPEEAPPALMVRLNHRLPEGLRIHQWEVLPAYASPLSDLALRSHWLWCIPHELRNHLEKRVATFLEATVWPWVRGSSKTDASLDLRRLIQEMRWEQDALCFTTRMENFQAINPLKVLGAILDLEPVGILGLVRTQVDLKVDPRLGQAERFEPKLKNMYEDAVLLGGGSNIILVDEDDDEPTILG